MIYLHIIIIIIIIMSLALKYEYLCNSFGHLEKPVENPCDQQSGHERYHAVEEASHRTPSAPLLAINNSFKSAIRNQSEVKAKAIVDLLTIYS